jgi:hypothetical protein
MMNLRDLRHLRSDFEWWHDFAGHPSFNQVDLAALQCIISALDMQIKYDMKLSRGLPKGTTMARKQLGIKGNAESLLEQAKTIQAECKLISVGVDNLVGQHGQTKDDQIAKAFT